MKTINKVILVGHLVADPEVRETQKGDTVATFRVATDRYSGKEKREEEAEDPNKVSADFHQVVAWDRLAEVVRDHLHKGQAVYVEGRLHNRSYELPDDTRRFVTEIRLDTLSILTWKGKEPHEEVESVSPPADSAVDVE